jgi:hypothetical protein
MGQRIRGLQAATVSPLLPSTALLAVVAARVRLAKIRLPIQSVVAAALASKAASPEFLYGAAAAAAVEFALERGASAALVEEVMGEAMEVQE